MPARWSDAKQKKMIQVYKTGASVGETARTMRTNRRIVRKYLRKHNVDIRPQSEAQTGEHNPFWKGGITYLKGYRFLRVPQHPNATRHGYVAEHRLVMEKKLGRYLGKKEVVHHLDGNKLNNSPGNLQVFVSNAKHLSHELKGRVPKWTEEGLRKMRRAARLKSEKAKQNLL